MTAAATSAGKPRRPAAKTGRAGAARAGTERGMRPKLPADVAGERVARVWQQELGGGYGGIAVSGGRVYVMDRQREPDDCRTRPVLRRGRPASRCGRIRIRSTTRASVTTTGPAPRRPSSATASTRWEPSAICIVSTRRSGEIVWSKDLVGEFGARVPIWGLSASPVVFEDLLIVHAGAEPDGCYVAFDLSTGEERWRSLPDPAGYATPILIERERIARQLVGWTPTNVRGLDPQTGKLLWTIPFEVNYGTSIADPIFHEGLVLVSSYYEGSKAIRLGAEAGRMRQWPGRIAETSAA